MSSGAKVVLAMLGGALAIALIVMAAFLLTDEPNLLCVEGELQDNQVGPDGSFLPRTETFATVAGAEAFVCRRIPHPRNTAGLALSDVEVVRTTNLGQLIEGDGRAVVTFRYSRDESGQPPISLEVSFPSLGGPEIEAPSEPVSLAGQAASLVRTGQGALVYWSAAGFDFAGVSQADDPDSLSRLLALLDSVR